ncbi:MAG: T9SS type A sorting domain-containing protein [Bacteroidia bacterium]
MKNKCIIFPAFFLLCLGPLQAQFPNVMIGNQHAPEEVSICINPKNNLQVVAGANIDNYYYSTDGGLHWTANTLVSPGNGVYGDPVVFADTSGSFYFMHLSNPPTGMGSWVDRIVCHHSIDGGRTYNNGTYTGKNGTKVQDKPWTAVNPANNEIYVCWTQFDVYGSHNPSDSSVILFSKSADNAVTWSAPKRISWQAGDCIDSDSTVEGAVPCVGPNGQIYVSWAGPQGLVFNKSLDGGATWIPRETGVNPIAGGWDYTISGLYRCNGLPVTACDLSAGPNRGAIYINWSDQRNGTTDTDIFLVKSTDGGLTWTSPKRVNTDAPGKQNFMSWMTIDQSNGDVYVVYYDRRNHTSGDSTDVYLARSSDGGATFTDYKINQNSFVPDPSVFFGDYIGVSATNGIVRPIWMAYNGSTLSIWTAIADAAMMGVQDSRPSGMPEAELIQNSPNPFHDGTLIRFNLLTRQTVTLYISNELGQRVVTIYDKQPMDKGGHYYIFNARTSGLKKGVYHYTLQCDSVQLTKKMTVTE